MEILQRLPILALVSDPSDRRALEEIFAESEWQIRHADSIEELSFQSEADLARVVICDHRLSDGDWLDLYRRLQNRKSPPELVVVSPQADDRLWAEVLSLGGFDLLMVPFDKQEVLRVTNSASRRSIGTAFAASA
jgi:DNA-binding NtrC family response regulator